MDSCFNPDLDFTVKFTSLFGHFDQDSFEQDNILESDDPLQQLPALPSSSSLAKITGCGQGQGSRQLEDGRAVAKPAAKKAPKVRNIKASCLFANWKLDRLDDWTWENTSKT